MVTTEAPSKTVKDAVARACFRVGVSFDIAWAICQVESGGKPVEGIGLSGEIGPMQVTPEAMIDGGYFADENSSIDDQVEAGVRYLRHLLDLFSDRVDQAVMAYNEGPDLVARDEDAGAEYLAKVRKFM